VRPILSTLVLGSFSFCTWAGPRDQALTIHNRLTGVPPSVATLNQMSTMINSGNALGAALLALDNPYFYNVKGKNWIKTWTNETRSSRVPLNDYVATVLGSIRDNVPFNQLLTEDILYVGGSGHGQDVRALAVDNNEHYFDLERRGVDLRQFLVRQTQSGLNGFPAAAVAGVITSRASAEAFFSAGTNRRMTRFLFINFLCHDFESLHDITIPDIYVRRDVERNPGGDSRTYRNSCSGCHAGQDALGGAWAFYDYRDSKIMYNNTSVQQKINKNNLYPGGHTVANDSWVNLWTVGQNSTLGWGPTTSGNGAKPFGQMITETKAYGECMAERSFEYACTRGPLTDEERDQIKQLGDEFMTVDNYSLRRLLAKTVLNCMGE